MLYGQLLYKLGVAIENVGRKLDAYAHSMKMTGTRLIRMGQTIIAQHSDEDQGIPF